MVHFTALQGVALSAASILITLAIAWLVWASRYPVLSSDKIHVAGHYWSVKRMLGFPRARLYLYTFSMWRQIDSVRRFRDSYGDQITITEKPFPCHLIDCGLIYPAVYVHVWLGLFAYFVGFR